MPLGDEEDVMSNQHLQSWSRRAFLDGVIGGAAVGIVGLPPTPAGVEALPETTRLRLALIPGTCFAPQYVAEEMLRAEGFADRRYVKMASTTQLYAALVSGEIDMSMAFIGHWWCRRIWIHRS